MISLISTRLINGRFLSLSKDSIVIDEWRKNESTIWLRLGLVSKPIIRSLGDQRASLVSWNANNAVALIAPNCIHFSFSLYLSLSLILSSHLSLSLLLSLAVIIIRVVMVTSYTLRNLTSLQIVRLFSTDKCLSAKHYLHSASRPSIIHSMPYTFCIYIVAVVVDRPTLLGLARAFK